MTTEEAKRRAELYSALAEGKTIQAQNPSGGEWFDVKIETLRSICEEINYRIKPEPKYRPFKNQEECWNEMLKHQPFGWVIETVTNYHKHITTVLGCNIIFYDSTGFKTSFDLMLRDCIFADGTPFGIKEE